MITRRVSLSRRRSDLFSTYSTSQRTSIVLTCALISALTPFTDTIYLPALKSISSDLNTTDSVVSLSVSIYLACVGLGQVIWGPLSDRYGRLPVLTGCLIIYQGITIAIIFAETISVLIAERAIQGFVVGTTIVSAQVIIADVFPPAERGAAMGRVFARNMLLGPIIAPLIGGILSQEFTWR